MIRILTDSTTDLTDRAEELGIDVLPLTVHFGEETYRDGVDLTNDQFYEKLSQAETLPKTAQINPEGFVDLFRRYVDAGDEVIGIFIASELSGTCQSANIAREMVSPEHIYVVDSRSVTSGAILLVLEALRLRDAGKSAAEIHAAVLALAARLRLYICTSTLKYLKMGGRISPEAAEQGTLLGVSPIVSIKEGVVSAAGKARGQKAAYQWMISQMDAHVPDNAYPFVFCNSANESGMRQFMAAVGERYDLTGAQTNVLGAVVGTHVGPGAVGVAYVERV